jgi:hypothetical protein
MASYNKDLYKQIILEHYSTIWRYIPHQFGKPFGDQYAPYG